MGHRCGHCRRLLWDYTETYCDSLCAAEHHPPGLLTRLAQLWRRRAGGAAR